jgi:hypothetical protein
MPNSLLNVYTKSSNLVNLQINSYGSLSIIDSIPIIVESVYIGSHRLKWASSSSIPNTKRVLLLDKYTNTLTDMRNFYEYPFQINSNPNSKGANRFVLIIGDNYALPVKWLDANAMVSNHDVWLNWSTTDETNNSHFVLSYSIDNSTFIEFDRVTSSKQILGINKYARLHIDIVSLLKQKGAKKIIYQIKQVDMDGREEYAPLIICNLEKTNLAGIAIRPNPAHDKIYISCNELIQPAQVTITNTLGVAFPVKLNVTNTEWEIELTNQMPTGIYFITIQDIYGAYHQTKFIKE